MKTFEGVKTMTTLSKFLEETLDSIKPGSRPAAGPRLPEPGAKVAEIGDPTHPINDLEKGNADPQTPDSHGPADHGTSKTRPASTSKSGKSTKHTATPNPAGQSTDLTPESFQQHVTMTDDPWFIKFYAPWCHHCQAMAPVWAQMAREMQGRLNVGEVNCEAHRRLCRDVHVKAYPTIHYFRGGERVEYEGLRGFGDLVSFAKKALDVGSHVPHVDAAQFKAMEETEDVMFVYFYDRATTDEDFAALDRLTLSLIGHAKLVKTDNKILSDRFKIHSWPRLLVSRNGRPSYYDSRSPKDMRDFRKVLGWMQSVWLPLVPELTALNSREIMTGRYVVLGILSRERVDDFLVGKREIKAAAGEWMDRETSAFQLERQEQRDSKQLRIEEAEDRNDQRALRQAKQMQITIAEQDRRQVGFAWIDGVYWERWLRTTYGIDVKEGEKVIINDEDVRFHITGPPPGLRNGGLILRTEQALLGHDHLGRLDRALAHLDPRDARQDHGRPAQAVAQVHDEQGRTGLLPGQGRHAGPPAPLGRALCRRCCHCVDLGREKAAEAEELGRLLPVGWKGGAPRRGAGREGGLREDLRGWCVHRACWGGWSILWLHNLAAFRGQRFWKRVLSVLEHCLANSSYSSVSVNVMMCP